nr:AmmeMemoRadiSam system protein B [Spirochaetota bacterium]
MWRREPVVAGSFYPSNPDRLSRDIDQYLSDARGDRLDGNIFAVISPHAGYIYSGPVAA